MTNKSFSMPQKKTRIIDIARLAGVSIGTVDRVLHNRGEVADGTRKKVKKIIKETNYSPNILAQVLKSTRIYNIVSLLPGGTEINSYWFKHPMGITQVMEEMELFQVHFTTVNFDMQSEEDFQMKASEVLEMEPDGVLLAPIFDLESTLFCARLSENDIPFVFIDGFIEETDFLAYTGEDMFRCGRVAGQLADLITPVESDILIISVAKHIQNVRHLNNRIKGFINYHKDSAINTGSKINVNIPEPTDEAVRTAMDKVLRENPGIGSIFVSGSKSYLIARYLEAEGINSIKIIGYDIHDSNIKYLKAGIIKFLISQRPEEQTYKSLKKLADYLCLNKDPERLEYLPIDIITSENVDFLWKAE